MSRFGYSRKLMPCGALPHTALIYGSNQTDSHTPHSTSLLFLELGRTNRIAGHIRKNTNDQTDSGKHHHHVKPYPALAYR